MMGKLQKLVIVTPEDEVSMPRDVFEALMNTENGSEWLEKQNDAYDVDMLKAVFGSVCADSDETSDDVQYVTNPTEGALNACDSTPENEPFDGLPHALDVVDPDVAEKGAQSFAKSAFRRLDSIDFVKYTDVLREANRRVHSVVQDSFRGENISPTIFCSFEDIVKEHADLIIDEPYKGLWVVIEQVDQLIEASKEEFKTDDELADGSDEPSEPKEDDLLREVQSFDGQRTTKFSQKFQNKMRRANCLQAIDHAKNFAQKSLAKLVDGSDYNVDPDNVEGLINVALDSVKDHVAQRPATAFMRAANRLDNDLSDMLRTSVSFQDLEEDVVDHSDDEESGDEIQ